MIQHSKGKSLPASMRGFGKAYIEQRRSEETSESARRFSNQEQQAFSPGRMSLNSLGFSSKLQLDEIRETDEEHNQRNKGSLNFLVEDSFQNSEDEILESKDIEENEDSKPETLTYGFKLSIKSDNNNVIDSFFDHHIA